VGPTRAVTFRQNVGLIILRLTKKVEGRLCRPCIERAFSELTLTTFFAGWWGFISFLLTPILLLMNIVEYNNACSSPELRGVPTTGKGRTVFKIIGGTIAVAALGGFMLFAGFVWLVASAPSRKYAANSTQGIAEDAFREAESKTLAYNGSEVAFGNTPQAQRYAAAFAKKLELMRKIAFSKAENAHAPSLTEGHFLTYCEVRHGKVCFLVHVPDLRHYTEDAKRSLADIAWELARHTGDSELEANTRVGVGLRGVLLYGAVLTGSRQQESPQRSEDPVLLHEFFTGPLVASAEVPSSTP
jgi:hypothetical protein